MGKPARQETYLITYFNEFLEKKKKLIGIDITQATWKKYYYACQQTQSFIKWQYKKNDISFSKLTSQFLDDFEFYLKTELNQRQVTVNKTIQRLRKPVKTAVGEGYLDKDPFALHKPGRVTKSVIFLTVEELTKLENHKIEQPRLQVVRDLFVFCCYTGLAYNEMRGLKNEHIVKGFDGNEWIEMKRKKTGKMISVPLLPKAKVILIKYMMIKMLHCQ
jgi:integrase/recombinase XerD